MIIKSILNKKQEIILSILNSRLNYAIPVERLSFKSKICLSVSLSIMITFFFIESAIIFEFLKSTYYTTVISDICIITFIPPFFVFVREFLDNISSHEKELLKQVMEKNIYLEHAAKILRHDMHSGINIYLPRGVRSLERRLEGKTDDLKIEAPLKLIKEGLAHSQQVYQGVYEFTNLVRQDAKLSVKKLDLKEVLDQYLKRTSYHDQVFISELLPSIYCNESLICLAIDNLIRNGLKYNDSKTKCVTIDNYDSSTISISDNGRGLSLEEFKEYVKPYIRNKHQSEPGSGLGLNICLAILKEHGFKISLKESIKGTTFLIDISNEINLKPEDDQ